jgi:hypothetical protein
MVRNTSPSHASRTTRGRVDPWRSITASIDVNSLSTTSSRLSAMPSSKPFALGSSPLASRTVSMSPSPEDSPESWRIGHGEDDIRSAVAFRAAATWSLVPFAPSEVFPTISG